MIFTLEALQAEAGDCLLLHYGDPAEPRLIVIDGGPTFGVYERLRSRLDALRDEGGFTAAGEPLPIELLMVSHIDDDHIDGILHLTQQLIDETTEKPFQIFEMWHNSFDDLLGNRSDDLSTAAHGAVAAASLGDDFFDQELVEPDTALILASVNQGRRLRDNARALSLRPPLLVAEENEEPRDFGDGLTLRLVGPLRPQLEALLTKWDRDLAASGAGQLTRAESAAFADKSAANLASLVVLAEADGKTLLLTGDARGDFLMESLRLQNLLDADGRLHVDIFKLPHHGSDRNVERSTFRDITAEHYVFSGDGHHGNPDVATFGLLFGGREDAGLLAEPFTLHLTYALEDLRAYRGKPYPVEELRQVLEEARESGHRFELLHPAAGEPSLVIDLLDPRP